MRSIRGALLAAAALGVGALPTVVGATPAAALSCAPAEGATPEAVAGGTFTFEDGTDFFDHYDFAVIGTVTAIRTDERQGSPTYGATEIDVVVDGVLGVGAAPEAMTLSAADPGWMAGYSFERGASYFIPVLAVSPEGKVNWTFLCDPIAQVADPAATALQLEQLAAGAGLPFGGPDEPGPTGSGGGTDSGSGDGAGWFVPAVTATALVAATTTAVVLLRRRPQLLAR